MESTLLLNASYEPLKVVDWRKAITLWCQGKVEVISVYPREVHSVSLTVKLPSVIRLLRYIRIKRHFNLVPFSRANIYARDHHRCQYCGRTLPPDELTFDHVVPVRHGGRKEWENIVTSCVRCNRRKGGRTPEEAGMAVISSPGHPPRAATVRIAIGVRSTAPEGWRDYLCWNVSLDDRN
jgi:5-methylcytosine-specific restriction endonuclease McrA